MEEGGEEEEEEEEEEGDNDDDDKVCLLLSFLFFVCPDPHEDLHVPRSSSRNTLEGKINVGEIEGELRPKKKIHHTQPISPPI